MVMYNNKDARVCLERPRPVPNLNIPHATATVDIRIINTTTYSKTKTENLLGQTLLGHETYAFPSYAFLIKHEKYHVNILFDLGMRSDWRNVTEHVTADKDINDVLTADFTPASVCSNDISAVIWSSHRFDHRGKITSFPSYTQLIVGPGMLDTYLNNEIDEQELEGRDVREMVRSDFKLGIGGFPAHDLFGDGSFYLLSCPGPSIGHMCGLARVTSSPVSTFVFLGADCAHHCGEFRPSPYLPLPKQVVFKPATWSYDNPSPNASAPSLRSRKILVCDGQTIRDKIHPLKSASDSFYATPPEPTVANYDDTNETLAKVELFDACPEILMCLSHDPTLMNVLPFYPFSINHWYKRGYKQRLQWEFLYDFDLEKMDDTKEKQLSRNRRY